MDKQMKTFDEMNKDIAVLIKMKEDLLIKEARERNLFDRVMINDKRVIREPFNLRGSDLLDSNGMVIYYHKTKTWIEADDIRLCGWYEIQGRFFLDPRVGNWNSCLYKNEWTKCVYLKNIYGAKRLSSEVLTAVVKNYLESLGFKDGSTFICQRSMSRHIFVGSQLSIQSNKDICIKSAVLFNFQTGSWAKPVKEELKGWYKIDRGAIIKDPVLNCYNNIGFCNDGRWSTNIYLGDYSLSMMKELSDEEVKNILSTHAITTLKIKKGTVFKSATSNRNYIYEDTGFRYTGGNLYAILAGTIFDGEKNTWATIIEQTIFIGGEMVKFSDKGALIGKAWFDRKEIEHIKELLDMGLDCDNLSKILKRME